MHPIDFIAKKYNITKYYISKVGNVTQSALSKAIERNQAIDSLSVKTVIAISKAIQKTPGETLDELLNYEEELKMENKIKEIRELAADIEKGMNGASIYIWDNKEEYFDNLRTNNDPDIDWEEVMKDELGRYGKNKGLVECNRGDGIPNFFTIDTPIDFIKSYFN